MFPAYLHHCIINAGNENVSRPERRLNREEAAGVRRERDRDDG